SAFALPVHRPLGSTHAPNSAPDRGTSSALEEVRISLIARDEAAAADTTADPTATIDARQAAVATRRRARPRWSPSSDHLPRPTLPGAMRFVKGRNDLGSFHPRRGRPYDVGSVCDAS